MVILNVNHPSKKVKGTVELPYSKSIYNRLLILKFLYFPEMVLPSESIANDSKVLLNALNATSTPLPDYTVDAQDAGTVYRFLQAYLCIKGGNYKITGTDKLTSRPSKELVESLQQIGFNILGTKLDSINGIEIRSNGVEDVQMFEWEIDVSESSQFASALALIAPAVGKPIQILLSQEAVSLSYLDLTIQTMQDLGMNISRKGQVITALPFEINHKYMEPKVERDWSSASYFFGMAILADSSDILLNGLSVHDQQPDKKIIEFGELFGVNAIQEESGIRLIGAANKLNPSALARDYLNCPDIALTEIVVCFALNVTLTATGTHHLAHKESDRLSSIYSELDRLNKRDGQQIEFETYHDHRMAMSLSMLGILHEVFIKNPNVVNKSFPNFWEQLHRLGFNLQSISNTNEQQ